jgi:predicted transcriptional regulator
MTSEEEKKISILTDQILMLSDEGRGKLISTLSDEEKDKLIIELRNRGYTYREIAPLLNVGPNQISKAIKKHQGIENQPAMNIRAFKMFEDGKKPIEVAIALQIGKEETLKYYDEYLNLKGLEVLIEAKNKLGNDFVSIIDLLKEMISSISLENIKEALRIAGKTSEAEDYLIITEMGRDRQIKAVEKLALVFSQLQKDTAIAK